MSGSRTAAAAPAAPAAPAASAAAVSPVRLPTLEQAPGSGSEQANIGLLLDVALRVTVELGSTTRTIREVLEVNEGAVIELDQLAGEPVAILVNHKPIARGEVVIVDDNFGVRVTEIVGRAEPPAAPGEHAAAAEG